MVLICQMYQNATVRGFQKRAAAESRQDAEQICCGYGGWQAGKDAADRTVIQWDKDDLDALGRCEAHTQRSGKLRAQRPHLRPSAGRQSVWETGGEAHNAAARIPLTAKA